MNKFLKDLIELSKIDKDIDAFEPRLELVKSELNEALDREKELNDNLEKIKIEIQEAELKKRKNELHLSELSEKLKEYSAKSGSIRNEKEAKALQLEEEIAKEQCDFANEEIERLEKLEESKMAEAKKVEEKIAEISLQVEQKRSEIENEIADIEKERQQVYENKQKLVSSMNQKILSFYEKIRKWAKNSTVVPVKKQACYGCYMRINDITFQNVKKAEEIVTCPHCGRILYYEQPTAE